MSQRPAVFLDRDGTIIEHVHYLRDPTDVRLVPGCGEALRLLRDCGFACVVVTNQSAIGRGMLTEDELHTIHEVMRRQLAAESAEIDGLYYCPVAPKAHGDQVAIEHADRKPGPGMLRRAADELGLDLARSFMVGDMISDVYAGRNAGCRASILIQNERAEDLGAHRDAIAFLARDVRDAAAWIRALVGDSKRHESGGR